MLKTFSEQHEQDREPFPDWCSRKISELGRERIWVIDMSRASFNGLWIQAESRFYFSEIQAEEMMKYWRSRSGLAWEFRVSKFERI